MKEKFYIFDTVFSCRHFASGGISGHCAYSSYGVHCLQEKVSVGILLWNLIVLLI